MESKFIRLPLRIDWSELDLFGHVNNVSFFKYIQAGRLNYWEKIGLTKFYEEQKLGPLLASAHVDFKMPLYYPGNIIVQTRMEFIKNSSFSFFHQILNDRNEIAAEGKDVMVMFDFNRQEKIPFPESLKKAVEEL
jgi:acyl-CoA thioester hydrolase